ncbi:MAG TPA: ATP-binding protein [Flavisolibacter sp.]
MEQVLEFFRKLFDTGDWPPRWYCGNWTDFHGWLYIISDILIWSAYFAIPLVILKYISKRSEAKFVRAYFLFAAFILACGSTHLLDAVAFWAPAYRLNALVRFITGLVSWITVFYMIRILPEATSLRSYAELEKEIREREKAEEQLKTANEQLNYAQEIARIGHWQWDLSQDTISWSDQLLRIYGMEHFDGDLSFEQFLARVHPEDRDLVQESIQSTLTTGKFSPFIHRIVLADGSVKILQGRGSVVHDENGKVVKMLGTGQDITDQYLAQQQLVERTHDLEASNADLEKFAYVASHDLQEPLRKTMTFASLLRKEADQGLSEKSRMYIDKIEQATGRMQRLIEDILQFSGIRSSVESFRQVDLDQVLHQVLSDLEVRISQVNAAVKADSLPVIQANATQMGQLFQNLLSNALKFSREDVAPVITISASMLFGHEVKDKQILSDRNFQVIRNALNWQRERFVQICIEDNGIGFEQAYAQKVFELFQRLHSRRSIGGTGIGLAICKKIVDNHHGVITAQSEPGRGALFTILLPMSQKMFTMQATG